MWRLSLALIAVSAALCGLTGSVHAATNPDHLQPNAEAWNDDSILRESEDDTFKTIVSSIITFVIVVVAICLILCFCCPICIIAKMRQRRGVVIRTNAPATVNGQTVTINLNRSAPPSSSSVMPAPQVVAIPNNYNARSKPYPVQESVTVVPLIHPQQQLQYQHQPPPQPMNINYGTGPQFPQNFELPPPYPGLTRESDTTNLPYNPYFGGEGGNATAPPPK
ncbi:hypothetical protein Ocin01_01867 [Orchesella cincta]|uniref:Uncharacterized protein n=1 Tax=Orchesella cincta TaxID=48709 RepID=A0A1D2NI90_ORCCI|nr:hypothetical protein Ocin01_01867 [Orchesella cincta]